MTFKTPKVSVIIPVYNSEKFIKRSVNQAQRQSLKEIEIILVNDGSPDNSIKIMQKLALEDKRIKIIDQPNLGVGVARTKGVLKSRGRIYSIFRL